MQRMFNFDLLHMPALALVAGLLICAAAVARAPGAGVAGRGSSFDVDTRGAKHVGRSEHAPSAPFRSPT